MQPLLCRRPVRIPGQDSVIVASGQASGPSPLPSLAERAVQDALERAGITRAERVLLLLGKGFSRQVPAALRAAAGTAACLQISGCTANGLLTEAGWQIDQPAAAAMVFAHLPSASDGADSPLLSFSGQGRLAWDWLDDTARAGLVDSDANAWRQARECNDARSTLELPGWHGTALLSRGLRYLGEAQAVTAADAHELRRLGTGTAVDSLLRALPGELRARPPLHQLVLIREEQLPGIGILSLNSDGSLTLGSPLQPGDTVSWAIRQPLTAEQEIRQQFAAAVDTGKRPEFALMFSCIGRGPLFYGNDDRDLLAFREHFPQVPLLGAYGTGQIVPGDKGNQLFQNTVLTLLYERTNVQSHP